MPVVPCLGPLAAHSCPAPTPRQFPTLPPASTHIKTYLCPSCTHMFKTPFGTLFHRTCRPFALGPPIPSPTTPSHLPMQLAPSVRAVHLPPTNHPFPPALRAPPLLYCLPTLLLTSHTTHALAGPLPFCAPTCPAFAFNALPQQPVPATYHPPTTLTPLVRIVPLPSIPTTRWAGRRANGRQRASRLFRMRSARFLCANTGSIGCVAHRHAALLRVICTITLSAGHQTYGSATLVTTHGISCR